MTIRTRPARVAVVGLIVTAATWAVAVASDPVWARAIGVDVWNVGRLEADLAEATATGQRLRSAADWQLARFQVNQQVVGELIAGRVRLADAAREMWAGNGDIPGYRARLALRFRDQTPVAQAAADLLDRAGRTLSADPVRRQAVLARLTAEYRAMSSE